MSKIDLVNKAIECYPIVTLDEEVVRCVCLDNEGVLVVTADDEIYYTNEQFQLLEFVYYKAHGVIK